VQAAREGQQIPEVIWSQFRRAGLVSGHVPIGNQILGWSVWEMGRMLAHLCVVKKREMSKTKAGIEFTEGNGVKEGWGGRYLS